MRMDTPAAVSHFLFKQAGSKTKTPGSKGQMEGSRATPPPSLGSEDLSLSRLFPLASLKLCGRRWWLFFWLDLPGEAACFSMRCQFGCRVGRGGSVGCTCPPGLHLAADNKTCEGEKHPPVCRCGDINHDQSQ